MIFFNDPNNLVIGGLLFLLGLLIGMFLTAGGRRKWKTRYNDEVGRRQALERTHKERETEWTSRDKEREAELETREKMRQAEIATREKELREQDSLRAAAAKSPRVAPADPVVVERDAEPTEPLILDADGRPVSPVVDPSNKRRRL